MQRPFQKKKSQLKSNIQSCRCKNFILKQASGLDPPLLCVWYVSTCALWNKRCYVFLLRCVALVVVDLCQTILLAQPFWLARFWSLREKTLHDLSKVLIENVFSSPGIHFLNPGPKVLRLVKIRAHLWPGIYQKVDTILTSADVWASATSKARQSQPRSQSSSAISDVTSPVKLVGISLLL